MAEQFQDNLYEGQFDIDFQQIESTNKILSNIEQKLNQETENKIANDINLLDNYNISNESFDFLQYKSSPTNKQHVQNKQINPDHHNQNFHIFENNQNKLQSKNDILQNNTNSFTKKENPSDSPKNFDLDYLLLEEKPQIPGKTSSSKPKQPEFSTNNTLNYTQTNKSFKQNNNNFSNNNNYYNNNNSIQDQFQILQQQFQNIQNPQKVQSQTTDSAQEQSDINYQNNNSLSNHNIFTNINNISNSGQKNHTYKQREELDQEMKDLKQRLQNIEQADSSHLNKYDFLLGQQKEHPASEKDRSANKQFFNQTSNQLSNQPGITANNLKSPSSFQYTLQPTNQSFNSPNNHNNHLQQIQMFNQKISLQEKDKSHSYITDNNFLNYLNADKKPPKESEQLFLRLERMEKFYENKNKIFIERVANLELENQKLKQENQSQQLSSNKVQEDCNIQLKYIQENYELRLKDQENKLNQHFEKAINNLKDKNHQMFIDKDAQLENFRKEILALRKENRTLKQQYETTFARLEYFKKKNFDVTSQITGQNDNNHHLNLNHNNKNDIQQSTDSEDIQNYQNLQRPTNHQQYSSQPKLSQNEHSLSLPKSNNNLPQKPDFQSSRGDLYQNEILKLKDELLQQKSENKKLASKLIKAKLNHQQNQIQILNDDEFNKNLNINTGNMTSKIQSKANYSNNSNNNLSQNNNNNFSQNYFHQNRDQAAKTPSNLSRFPDSQNSNIEVEELRKYAVSLEKSYSTLEEKHQHQLSKNQQLQYSLNQIQEKNLNQRPNDYENFNNIFNANQNLINPQNSKKISKNQIKFDQFDNENEPQDSNNQNYKKYQQRPPIKHDSKKKSKPEKIQNDFNVNYQNLGNSSNSAQNRKGISNSPINLRSTNVSNKKTPLLSTRSKSAFRGKDF